MSESIAQLDTRSQHENVRSGVDQRSAWHFTPVRAMWTAIWGLAAVGVLAILCYAVSTKGQHLAYFGTGVLTAFAAGLSGGFFGFLLGVPRVVSSGAMRQGAELGAAGHTVPPTGQSPPPDASRFSPSTNLAEVSDWLTKLLLGAGLVSLTKLGEPAGRLFRTIAGGLSSTGSGGAVVVAGAIVLTFAALGFMGTYVATSIWYKNMLEARN